MHRAAELVTLQVASHGELRDIKAPETHAPEAPGEGPQAGASGHHPHPSLLHPEDCLWLVSHLFPQSCYYPQSVPLATPIPDLQTWNLSFIMRFRSL